MLNIMISLILLTKSILNVNLFFLQTICEHVDSETTIYELLDKTILEIYSSNKASIFTCYSIALYKTDYNH